MIHMSAVSPPAIVAYQDQKAIETNFQDNIKMCEQKEIWSNFAEISKIYRESGHCKAISNYLKIKLESSGFKTIQKKDRTIVAYRGLNKEKNNAIILQSHMDIVAISADGNPKKPIKPCIKEGYVYANDRTLGADDGIGIAIMLTIAQDEKFKNYPLQMIFTVDEETTMSGAKNLHAKDFYGKYLINLDTEDYGVITKGCAGITEYKIKEKIPMQKLNSNAYNKVTIELKGAAGGHSATIKPESLNPILILIKELKCLENIKLVLISGGERRNAIPREAYAEILVPETNAENIKSRLKNDLEIIKEKNLALNPDFTYSISTQKTESETTYINANFQEKLFTYLNEIPTGLLSTFDNYGTAKTSQNLGILKIKKGEFNIDIMGRSADFKEKEELIKKTSCVLSKLLNKNITPNIDTPAWQQKDASKLENIAKEAFCKISGGTAAKVKIEHGGVECGAFAQKVSNLEQISIGPTIEDAHSVKERVKIDTISPFYNWISKIIELLAKN